MKKSNYKAYGKPDLYAGKHCKQCAYTKNCSDKKSNNWCNKFRPKKGV